MTNLNRAVAVVATALFLTTGQRPAAAAPAAAGGDEPPARQPANSDAATPPAEAPAPDADAGPSRETKPPSDKAKAEDVRRLLVASGAGELGVQAFRQMQTQYRRAFPQVPDSFWKELQKEINAGEMIELVVPIYAKYFTQQDVKDLIRFYESPVGKKLIKVQPRILSESMQAGQVWGKAIAEKVVKRLKSEGYITA